MRDNLFLCSQDLNIRLVIVANGGVSEVGSGIKIFVRLVYICLPSFFSFVLGSLVFAFAKLTAYWHSKLAF